MAPKKTSPNRRRSIAVTNQNKPTILPRAKRRPHSIVPGDRLSPFAKARRSLAPRKSILKASLNLFRNDDPPTDSQPSSQAPSQSSTADDTNATTSMDITHDFHTRVHDNTSRKSFGRRVSFADHAQVRLFEIPDNNNTNNTDSPQSSPAQNPAVQQEVTDENAYPGASGRSRRRSSARYSLANSEGEDMDLTSVMPSIFHQDPHGAGSAVADEEFDFDLYDDDGMEMTEVVRGELIRKRSLSLGLVASQVQFANPHQEESYLPDDPDQSQSYAEGDSQSQSDIDPDHSQAMEFTVPLNQSLRPPAHHDEAWLALRQATHSGDSPYEPEPSSDDHVQKGADDMVLDDAVQRLLRARNSLPGLHSSGEQYTQDTGLYPENAGENNSYSSTEDSLREDDDIGDRTMNVSKVLGRVSLGGGASRMSMGYQNSTMDESEIYGAIVPLTQSTPRQPQSQSQPPSSPPASNSEPVLPRLTVFQPPPVFTPAPPSVPAPQPPPTSTQASRQPTIPIPFSFTPKAPTSPSKSKAVAPVQTSPSKSRPKPTFSAAFAPPVARPSPKKTDAPPQPPASPNKRPRSPTENADNHDSDKPSPAKRLAVSGKWPATSNTPVASTSTVAPSTESPRPRPLSPSKKAPFQAPVQRPTASLRRPSGYNARRKSLGVGLGAPPVEEAEPVSAARPSLPKKAGGWAGRASMGSAPVDAWTRFNKNAGSGVNYKSLIDKAKEVEAESCVREANRQASASPSPTRGSPAPRSTSPRPALPVTNKIVPSNVPPPSSVPAAPVVDLSDLGPGGFGEEANEEAEVDMDMDMDPTEHWREGVEQNEFADEEGPLISIEQFFSMTGIKFMDELTAPRRSTHPSQQPIRQPRNPAEIPLAEYVTAMGIDVPQLVLYSRVSKDLQAWMEQSKAVFAQAEDEATKITPELFTEYSRADEEGQAELLHQLNLIRTNTRGLARSDWYDWKLQWVEGLRVTADRAFNALEADAKVLEGIKASADEVIPALMNEYEEVMQELEREKAEVAEIEASDQDYLNELKGSIAEQNVEVEALQAEVAEGKAQLSWLQERLEEIEAQKQEAATAIADAKRFLHIQKNSTRAEVFRLKDELEALEDLHMFRATKVNPDLFEYIYASRYRVSIPCNNFIPIISKVDINRVDKGQVKFKDDFPQLSNFLLDMAKQQIVEGKNLTVRQIVHRLGDYWTSCAQLRSQLTLLNIKYPVVLEFSRPLQSFKAKAMVMFPSKKAKAYISFIFTTDTFCCWPSSINTLDCEVEVAYGLIDRETIFKAVTSRLSQVSPADNYACLLDACIEAQDEYR